MTKIPLSPLGRGMGWGAFRLFGHWIIGIYLEFEIWLLGFIQTN
jgi:hypothetical protein